jgi:Smr domain
MSQNESQMEMLGKCFPDFGRDILSDILEAHGGHMNSVLAVLSEMTSGTEPHNANRDKATGCSPDSGSPAESDMPVSASDSMMPNTISNDLPTVEQRGKQDSTDLAAQGNSELAVSKDVEGDDLELALYTEAFQQLETDYDRDYAVAINFEENEINEAELKARTMDKDRNLLQGTWKSRKASGDGSIDRLTYAGKLAVNRIAETYRWADKNRIACLHWAAGECEALTVELLLDESPELRSVACKLASPSRSSSHIALPHALSNAGASKASASVHVAEALREQDITELAAASRPNGTVSSANLIDGLRSDLDSFTRERECNQALYGRTRKSKFAQEAKRLDADVRQAWTKLLAAIRNSPSFRAGDVDMHGLTAEQAIEVVDAKLSEGGGVGKIRFITGRGNNSSGGRSILRPRVENHLSMLGIPYSVDDTGGVLLVRWRT